PLFFCNMEWKVRRKILSEMAGNIEQQDIINTLDSEQQNVLTGVLNSGKSFADALSIAKSTKKKAKDEVDLIPARTDESNRAMPPVLAWRVIESGIEQLANQVSEIDAEFENKGHSVDKEIERVNGLKKE